MNWYGYKGQLAVRTQSQYILGALLSSGSMNDGKAAIPLLKGLQAQFPTYRFSYATMDAGYRSEKIRSARTSKYIPERVLSIKQRKTPNRNKSEAAFYPRNISLQQYAAVF